MNGSSGNPAFSVGNETALIMVPLAMLSRKLYPSPLAYPCWGLEACIEPDDIAQAIEQRRFSDPNQTVAGHEINAYDDHVARIAWLSECANPDDFCLEATMGADEVSIEVLDGHHRYCALDYMGADWVAIHLLYGTQRWVDQLLDRIGGFWAGDRPQTEVFGEGVFPIMGADGFCDCYAHVFDHPFEGKIWVDDISTTGSSLARLNKRSWEVHSVNSQGHPSEDHQATGFGIRELETLFEDYVEAFIHSCQQHIFGRNEQFSDYIREAAALFPAPQSHSSASITE